MRWVLLLGISAGWSQTTLWVEGAIGGVHRVPVAKEQPWSDLGKAAGGSRRQPGPWVSGGWMLRQQYHPVRFVEVGMRASWLSLQEEAQRESFFLATVPLRAGWRLDTTARPWWIWGGIAASLLLNAQSRSDPAQVYRFQDYFARSQLHGEVGIERTLPPRWQVGMHVRWDLTPAWDRVLFQASRTLAHHLGAVGYVRYRLWDSL